MPSLSEPGEPDYLSGRVPLDLSRYRISVPERDGFSPSHLSVSYETQCADIPTKMNPEGVESEKGTNERATQ